MRGLIATLVVCLGAVSASAQGTRCSAFLHERDGSWRSFTTDEMLLPEGPVPIHAGEHFSARDRGAKRFIARLLDAQCEPGGPLY